MSKRSAAAGAPAAPAAALACGNAACGKALAPPLLQCSKCKAEAYCCKQGCSKRKLTFKLGGSKLTFGSSLVRGRKRVCMRLLRAPWGHIPYNVN